MEILQILESSLYKRPGNSTQVKTMLVVSTVDILFTIPVF